MCNLKGEFLKIKKNKFVVKALNWNFHYLGPVLQFPLQISYVASANILHFPFCQWGGKRSGMWCKRSSQRFIALGGVGSPPFLPLKTGIFLVAQHVSCKKTGDDLFPSSEPQAAALVPLQLLRSSHFRSWSQSQSQIRGGSGWGQCFIAQGTVLPMSI